MPAEELMAQFRGEDRVLFRAEGGHLGELPHC
jgi:hypothetical protein